MKLPEVTIVVIDCVAHDLTHEALRDTLRHIEPERVLVFSDRKILFQADHIFSDIRSIRQMSEFLWYEVPKHISTSHFLFMQYDGWVLNENAWNPEWLNYDYIGAPWWHNRLNVGNGGFSLRSADLARYISDMRDIFPFSEPEDDTLCRRYRPKLHQAGFEWPDEREAQKFSFERILVNNPTFGFHGIFNWARILTPDALQYRADLANDYVKNKIEWNELFPPGVSMRALSQVASNG